VSRPPDPSATERSRELAASMGDLIHRFNNALTTIVGLADWHLVTESATELLREDLHRIRAAGLSAEQTARQMQRLMEDAAQASATDARDRRAGVTHGAERTAAQEGPAQAAGGRVVLVDDQAEVRASLGVMIRTLGYDVHAVAGGADALAALEQGPAAALVTDLGMPDMDGRQLAEAVRARFPRVPVVLLTGWADAASEMPAAVARVLPKPLRMSQLREALAAVITSDAA
jgi:CheY-like chemotaxis protein